MELKKLVRFSDWWSYKIPPMLCFAYIFLFVNAVAFQKALIYIGLFFLWIFGTAGIGHITNDIADIESDRIAGKQNNISTTSHFKRIWLLVFLFFLSIAPWYYLPINFLLAGLVFLEVILFIAYSFPPVRLKERPVGGIITDALYAHAIPVLISSITFYLFDNRIKISSTFFILIFIWQLILGIRNILLHQIEDIDNDIKSNTITFVVKYGQTKTFKLINHFLLPAEIIFCCVIIGAISIYLNHFYLVFVLFLFFSILKHGFWKIFSLPLNHWQKAYLFFLNDFYEEWMPLLPLIYLLQISPAFFLLLALHVILFNNIIIQFNNDIKFIRCNIKELVYVWNNRSN